MRGHSKSRRCNHPGCTELASPGWSKCELHGKAAVEAGRLERERWARDAAAIRQNERPRLSKALGVGFDVLDDLVAYIKEQS